MISYLRKPNLFRSYPTAVCKLTEGGRGSGVEFRATFDNPLVMSFLALQGDDLDDAVAS